MAADAIARVVADLRAGRQRKLKDYSDPTLQGLVDEVAAWPGPVVDATAIYQSLVARDEPVYLYEDHPCIAPPWVGATICYENEHGNVIAMSSMAKDYEGPEADDPTGLDEHRHITQPGPWTPAEPVDWEAVRWIFDSWLWIGGRGGRGPIVTAGPLHWWRFAIYEDGTPADLHWMHIVPEYPMERWDMAHLVLLGALNFCNCRNVELVNPQRPRAEARRIARTGVDVHTINVFPAGRSTRAARNGDSVGVPLTSVRGHFAHYGACCPHHEPRGLLFGKLTGRYFIPQHARGDASLGESKADYRLVTEAS